MTRQEICEVCLRSNFDTSKRHIKREQFKSKDTLKDTPKRAAAAAAHCCCSCTNFTQDSIQAPKIFHLCIVGVVLLLTHQREQLY